MTNYTRALFFKRHGWRNALNSSGSSPIASSSATSVGTFAKFRSRSHDAVIRVYDDAGNVIETHEHGGLLQRNFAHVLAAHDFANFQPLRLCGELLIWCPRDFSGDRIGLLAQAV